MSDYLTEEEQKKLNSKLTGLYTHIRNVETDQQKLYQKRGLSFLPGRKKKSEEMRENEWQELEKRKKNYKDSIKRITGEFYASLGKKVPDQPQPRTSRALTPAPATPPRRDMTPAHVTTAHATPTRAVSRTPEHTNVARLVWNRPLPHDETTFGRDAPCSSSHMAVMEEEEEMESGRAEEVEDGAFKRGQVDEYNQWRFRKMRGEPDSDEEDEDESEVEEEEGGGNDGQAAGEEERGNGVDKRISKLGNASWIFSGLIQGKVNKHGDTIINPVRDKKESQITLRLGTDIYAYTRDSRLSNGFRYACLGCMKVNVSRRGLFPVDSVSAFHLRTNYIEGDPTHIHWPMPSYQQHVRYCRPLQVPDSTDAKPFLPSRHPDFNAHFAKQLRSFLNDFCPRPKAAIAAKVLYVICDRKGGGAIWIGETSEPYDRVRHHTTRGVYNKNTTMFCILLANLTRIEAELLEHAVLQTKHAATVVRYNPTRVWDVSPAVVDLLNILLGFVLHHRQDFEYLRQSEPNPRLVSHFTP